MTYITDQKDSSATRIDLYAVKSLPLPDLRYHDEYRRGYAAALSDVARLAATTPAAQAPKDPSVFDIMAQQVKEDLHPAVEIMRSQAPQAANQTTNSSATSEELQRYLDWYAAAKTSAEARNAKACIESLIRATNAPQAATPLPGQRIDRRESIADNADAMIILTQNYPREDKIRIVDAHTERNVRAALTQQSAPEAPASDTDEFMDTLKGAAKEATDEWIAGFVRQHFGIYAVTTASASGNHALATDELWTQMDEYTQGLPAADQLVLGRFWNWLKAHAPAPEVPDH